MIDMESEIFDEVRTRVLAAYPEVFMTGEVVRMPSSFPCISLVEIDNAAYRNSLTNMGTDNHAAVTYEVNIYSAKTQGRKSECKRLAAAVDDVLMSLNFARMMLEPVPNWEDASVYRMLGRYRAVVSKDHVIYRR